MDSEETVQKLRADFLSSVAAILRFSATKEHDCLDRDEVLELLLLNDLVDDIAPVIGALSTDEDELVRATAIDVASELQLWGAEEVYVPALKDPSSLVRGCAACAIGKTMSMGSAKDLQQALDLETDDSVRQRIYYALWKLGYHQYSFRFLEGLFHEHYVVRCFTANLLRDFVTELNRSFFVHLVKTAHVMELTVAAREDLADFLADFESDTDGNYIGRA
ncbi:MAG: HEAT repeat domain-containing protein [FCB group bacterium]|jgi:HEAT repeat protein|nr:HEAT repeat domain-containing protein [FCB group bacterium]